MPHPGSFHTRAGFREREGAEERDTSPDAELWPTLFDPVDHGLPGSSVHGVLQARTAEWAAISTPGVRDGLKDGLSPPALLM